MDSKENKLPTSEEQQARAIYEELLKRHPRDKKRIQQYWEDDPSLERMQRVLDMENMLF